ncbi:MAG: hypothetical protein J0H38_16035 [Rhizobiales bacterium]|nr:hypothetical protein [Hyphomicrobiales bacterium]
MGITVKNILLSSAVLLAIGATSAAAADLPAKVYTKAPPVAAFDPWDIAFGAGITNDYLFRGVTQSNHKPSANAYFEPRYNVNKDLQLYVGTSASSIAFANRASVELDGYFGVRPTFGPVAFDFGFWYYGYPGGTCFAGVAGFGAECAANALANGNFIKKDVSFYEGYAKVNWTINDVVTVGGNAYYSPNFLNTGADGTYASITGKITAPSTFFGSSGIGAYISGEFGRQWLGTSDAFYGNIKYADYNTWNIGVGFTYKVFTLDIRYSDTDLSRANCNAFTSDHTATFDGSFSPINPSGVGSGWCGPAGIVKLSADLTAMTNLK